MSDHEDWRSIEVTGVIAAAAIAIVFGLLMRIPWWVVLSIGPLAGFYLCLHSWIYHKDYDDR